MLTKSKVDNFGKYVPLLYDVYCLSLFLAMLVASDAFADAVREVYEPEWPGRDKLEQYLEVCENRTISPSRSEPFQFLTLQRNGKVKIKFKKMLETP